MKDGSIQRQTAPSFTKLDFPRPEIAAGAHPPRARSQHARHPRTHAPTQGTGAQRWVGGKGRRWPSSWLWWATYATRPIRIQRCAPCFHAGHNESAASPELPRRWRCKSFIHKRVVHGHDKDLTCILQFGVIDITRHMGRRARGTYSSKGQLSH